MPAGRFFVVAALVVAVIPCAPANAQLSKEEKDAGFVSLLKDDLSSWQKPDLEKVFSINDAGTLVCAPQKGKRTLLYSAAEYGDFILRFDFLLTKGANSCLGFRMPLKGGHPYNLGLEIQLLDDANAQPMDFGPEVKKNPTRAPLYLHGSLCGLVAPMVNHGKLKPAEQWNSLEVIVKGRNLQVILNGTKILDVVNLDEVKPAKPGLKRTTGHICLEAHRGQVEFRNMRIKKLD